MPTINKPAKNYRKNQNRNPMRKVRAKFYASPLWRELRLAHLMEHPLCEVCEMQEKTTLATDVHHLVSWTRFKATERDAVATDPKNLASLCKSCHWECHHGKLKGCKSLEEIAQRLKIANKEEEDNADDQPKTYVF